MKTFMPDWTRWPDALRLPSVMGVTSSMRSTSRKAGRSEQPNSTASCGPSVEPKERYFPPKIGECTECGHDRGLRTTDGIEDYWECADCGADHGSLGLGPEP